MTTELYCPLSRLRERAGVRGIESQRRGACAPHPNPLPRAGEGAMQGR
jgi:hypothetical protein